MVYDPDAKISNPKAAMGLDTVADHHRKMQTKEAEYSIGDMIISFLGFSKS